MAVASPPIATQLASGRRHAWLESALPWLALAVAGVGLPLLDDSYVGVIAQRACIYWILVAGLNLVVGFAGQIAIGWVALLTVGAYTTAVLTAGTVTSEWNPYLALAASGLAGVVFGGIVGYSAFIYTMHHLPVALVSIYTYVNPMVAVALGWWVYREPFGWRETVAMIVIFAGVAIVKWTTSRSQRLAEASVPIE